MSDPFDLPSLELAQALLGKFLIHETPQGTAGGMIVETEAYRGALDAAAHSYRGITPRTTVMFGPPGHAYVYFTYGMHYCFNVTAAENGVGEAVLIRALEPIAGIELMIQRRGRSQEKDLCNGPAKLVQALGITKDDNGRDLRQGPLRIADQLDGREKPEKIEITAARRVGISQAQEHLWRFYIAGSSWISRA